MESKPWLLQEGVGELLKVVSLDRIAVVEITKRNGRHDSFIHSLKSFQASANLTIPKDKILQYTPPNNIGNKYRISLDTTSRYLSGQDQIEPRSESIPKINDSSLTYLIFDDIIETGETLSYAMGVLRTQEVNLDRIWACIRTLNELRECIGLVYLDKAQNFLRYLEDSKQRRKDEWRGLVRVLMGQAKEVDL